MNRTPILDGGCRGVEERLHLVYDPFFVVVVIGRMPFFLQIDKCLSHTLELGRNNLQ